MFISLGVPLILFCDNGDDDEQNSSEKATDAGIGAQESIGARPLGESASNLEGEPDASRKIKADPGDGEGPSSVRRKVASESEPSPSHATKELPSLNEEEEALLWKKSDDWILQNLSNLEDEIQDEVSRLRKEEGMRAIAPERISRTIEDLSERYGIDKLPEILHDMKTNGKSSRFYSETKALVRELDREGINAKILKKAWDGKLNYHFCF